VTPEADFIENERSEDAIADTPIGSWILALFDHPREYGPGFAEQSHHVDSGKFYQPPPLPKGFDPSTSVSGAQIAKLMTVALESDYWNDIEPVLPARFKSLVTNPVWYADPALYETQQPWYFEIPNREYAGYDSARQEVLQAESLHVRRQRHRKNARLVPERKKGVIGIGIGAHKARRTRPPAAAGVQTRIPAGPAGAGIGDRVCLGIGPVRVARKRVGSA
jgi:hypothetical protein